MGINWFILLNDDYEMNKDFQSFFYEDILRMIESCWSLIPFGEDGITLGSGPAAGHVLVVGGSSACGDSSGKVSWNGDSSRSRAVIHGPWPHEVIFASASVVPSVGVNPSLKGKSSFVVGSVGLEGEGHWEKEE